MFQLKRQPNNGALKQRNAMHGTGQAVHRSTEKKLGHGALVEDAAQLASSMADYNCKLMSSPEIGLQ